MAERAYPRIRLHAEASIRCGERDYPGILEDLSLIGTYIRTDKRISVGDSAEISFSDTAAARDYRVRFNGSVVRVDDDGIVFVLRRIDIDSFLKLHLIVARQSANV